MTLTDTHCHLDSNKFDADRADVIGRARLAGVARILVPGVDLLSSLSAIRLAEGDEILYAAAGIHPTEAAGYDPSSVSALRKLAQHPRVRAIGEIGLDYYWDRAAHALQQKVLKDQLALAAELVLPVVIHFREKADVQDGECARDLLAVLEQWTAGLHEQNSPLAERPGVLHSFSGTPELAGLMMCKNFMIGVTGPVTHRKERQELVAGLPLERMLVETDAPYMAPVPWRGRRNEPAFVRHIADKIAMLKSCTVEEVEAVTTANAARLFCWD